MIPIVGNICEPNLGMDSDSARAIMEDVNVIIESAAITNLDERLVFFHLLILVTSFLGLNNRVIFN